MDQLKISSLADYFVNVSVLRGASIFCIYRWKIMGLLLQMSSTFIDKHVSIVKPSNDKGNYKDNKLWPVRQPSG